MDSNNQWDNLETVIDQLWHMLTAGAGQPGHPFYLPVLGTTNPVHGSDLRIVVLRQVNANARHLICYTDARSNKLVDIRYDKRVSLLFYHAQKRVQLRLRGIATIHTDDALAEQAWQQTPLTNQHNYKKPEPPGSPLTQPTTTLLNDTTDAESIRTPHFAVICTQVDFVDWLWLRNSGHWRAQFQWQADAWQGTWVTP